MGLPSAGFFNSAVAAVLELLSEFALDSHARETYGLFAVDIMLYEDRGAGACETLDGDGTSKTL